MMVMASPWLIYNYYSHPESHLAAPHEGVAINVS
jgi:hypothetical protein